MNNPLLTIAIPTYNRCKILDATLQTYGNDPDFDERTEIVISDNCSTDATKQVVENYSKKFPQIKYYCNSENIIDRNFSKAMSLGNGEYIKLTNDTAVPNKNTLKTFLEAINKHHEDREQLFFYQNTWRFKNTAIETATLDYFIHVASYFAGWILNFGAWRTEFTNLTEKDRFAHSQFLQVDWTLRLVQSKGKALIYFGDYFTITDPVKKNAYNIFEVFAKNYMLLYNEYLATGAISKKTISNEKYQLYRYFFVPWIENIFITKIAQGSFETKNCIPILFKRYWWHYYFYLGLIKLVALKILHLNKTAFKMVKKDEKNN